MSEVGYRSLAEQLRAWPEKKIASLLAERPDLATPAPHDSAQLASRATTQVSLARALDRLNRCELFILDAHICAGQNLDVDIATITNASAPAFEAGQHRLLSMALLWESTTGLRAVSGLADVIAGGPAAGQSGVRGWIDSLSGVAERIGRLSPAARALLEHVDAHGGVGQRRSPASGPVEELLSAGLLRPQADGLAVVPGEVSVALRGGHTTRDRIDLPPEIATAERAETLIERTASGAANEFVRRVELLLDQWGLHPPATLRSGGLGVRDLKAAAAGMDVDERTAALLIETAYAAGLLSTGSDSEGNERWLPTDGFDLWTTKSTGHRWLVLVQAWLDSSRMPALIGSKDPGGKTINALSPDLSSGIQRETRTMALQVLAGLDPGAALAAGTGLPTLVAHLNWLRPRRIRIRDDQAAWAVAEAATLGVTGLDAVTSYGKALLAGEPERSVELLSSLLPEPVDHLLLQADLTAIAPGPLASDLAKTVHLLADVESRGGATVYRFTRDSIRRAFDSGWSAREVHDFLNRIARTPVPQPLTFMVDDVARTFGTVRVGMVECFLRSDDETALTELLHHPRAATWGLRRLAPTVVVSTTGLDVLLPRLRELGLAPVVEAADGTVQVARRDLQRARRKPGRTPPGAVAVREASALSAAVATIRAGDRAAKSRPAASATSPAEALAWLREAVEIGGSVVIGYTDNQGQVGSRVVNPLRVEGGTLTAFDHGAEDARTFAVHRITSVAAIENGNKTENS